MLREAYQHAHILTASVTLTLQVSSILDQNLKCHVGLMRKGKVPHHGSCYL